MKFLRPIALILATLLPFWACDIERPVDTPVGNWEVSASSLLIELPDGTQIHGSTARELKDGLVQALEPQLEKLHFFSLEDFLEFGDLEKEDEPMIPAGSVRLEFHDDETLLVWTREDGEWQETSSGEWSYAEGLMTLYIDRVVYNCTVEKLTNKRLFFKVAFPDWSTVLGRKDGYEQFTRAGIMDELGALGELLAILMGMQMSADLQFTHL